MAVLFSMNISRGFAFGFATCAVVLIGASSLAQVASHLAPTALAQANPPSEGGSSASDSALQASQPRDGKETSKEPESSQPDVSLIGLKMSRIAAHIAKARQQDDPFGAVVQTVSPGLPAAQAGIRPGDVILTIDDMPINLPGDLPQLIAKTTVGQILIITVLRDNQRIHLSLITVGARILAQSGNVYGMMGIAEAYRNGRVISKDYIEAARWFRRGADLGEATAMYSLGSLYMSGSGVTKDYGETVRWYRKAADLGDVNAMDALAALFINGLACREATRKR